MCLGVQRRVVGGSGMDAVPDLPVMGVRLSAAVSVLSTTQQDPLGVRQARAVADWSEAGRERREENG